MTTAVDRAPLERDTEAALERDTEAARGRDTEAARQARPTR
ncbi:hypothetical protein ABZ370_05990 [Streptomyces sp. NPDC005962]